MILCSPKVPFQLNDSMIIQSSSPKVTQLNQGNQKPVSAGWVRLALRMTQWVPEAAQGWRYKLAAIWHLYRNTEHCPFGYTTSEWHSQPGRWTSYINRKLLSRPKHCSVLGPKETWGCPCMHKEFPLCSAEKLKEESSWKGSQLAHTYPLCMEALGSLLVFTSIMSRERRKKNTAMAKLTR